MKIFEKFNYSFRHMNLGNLYMALTLAKLKHNRLTISAAGMPPALVCRATTNSVDEVVLRGMPLGARNGFSYQQMQLDLAPGDTLVLMSDGFPELFNRKREMLDYPRVKQYLQQVSEKTPDEIISHLIGKVEEWRENRPQDDDITFVVLRVKKHS